MKKDKSYEASTGEAPSVFPGYTTSVGSFFSSTDPGSITRSMSNSYTLTAANNMT